MPEPNHATRPRIRVFTGAPLAARLDWDEHSLGNDWTPAVRYFLERGGSLEDTETAGIASRWRSIPCSRDANAHTGFTQSTPRNRVDPAQEPRYAQEEASSPDDDESPGLSSTPEDVGLLPELPVYSSDEEDQNNQEEEEEEEFIEHSIFVHDELQSSQLALSPLEDTNTTILTSFHTTSTSFGSTSFLSNPSTASDPSTLLPAAQPLTTLPHTTPLADLPNPAHLRRIIPQTIVLNLLIGILSIAPARTVRTRRGQLRDLVELLVGDETATGLRVSFWFAHRESPPLRPSPAPLPRPRQERQEGPAAREDDALRATLQRLRVQDVVLLENVALDVFRDKVYGHSLRRSMQKNQTRVTLLSRNGGDRVAGLGGVEREKVGRVREWVGSFVDPGAGVAGREESEGGRGGRGGGGEGGGGAGAVWLPPDTQD